MIKEPVKEELLKESRICRVEKYERGDDKNYTVYFDTGVKALFDEEEFYKFDLFDTEAFMKVPLCEFAYEVNGRRCYLTGVALLNASLKPSGFVARTLRECGFEAGQINEALAQLTEDNYLDDERYASKYVLKKSEAGNTSCKMIEMELISKGVPEEIARGCIAEAGTDDFKNALKIVDKKRAAGDSDAKIMRYLAGKGFQSSTIIKAVNGYEE